jgi:serine/threonine protein kinase
MQITVMRQLNASTTSSYVRDAARRFFPENVVPLHLSQCLNPNCFASNQGVTAACQHCGHSLLLGGRYRAIHEIGSGGFAKTYKALDEHRLNTSCVIKQFLPQRFDPQTSLKATDLFEQEAVLLRDLGNHPQVPALKAFLQKEEQLFIVQDYVHGETLLDIYNRDGAFSEAQIRQILTSLLPVLQFIHDRQVVHRDIKPSNVMRQPDGTLVLIDFGSSYQSYITLSQRRAPRTVTLGYASPEQLRGEVCPASDLYSLGLTCLRLYTGDFPAEGDADPLLDHRLPLSERHPSLPHMGESLKYLFTKLLQPSLPDRYRSASEVLADLSQTPQFSVLEPCVQSPTAANKPTLSEGLTLDYVRLTQLLANKNYREADEETWRLLLQIAQRETTGKLDLVSLETCPLEPLRQLDALWQHYSGGRQGLSVQFQQFRDLSGNDPFHFDHWQNFAEQRGWCRSSQWLSYDQLSFDSLDRDGHLPAWCIDPKARRGEQIGMMGWWRLGFITLLHRWDAQQNY